MTILDRALGRPRAITPNPGDSRAGARRLALAREPRLRLRLRPMLLVGAAAIVVIGVLRIVQSSDATSTNFQIQALEEQRLDWQTRVQQLEAEVSVNLSLNRVEQEARGRLGMAPSGQPNRVTVGMQLPEQSLKPGSNVPASAEGADNESGSSWWQDLDELLPFP